MAPNYASRRPATLIAFFLALQLQNMPSRAAQPQVDFDRMGRVAVAGSFAGIDLFDPSSKTPTTFDRTTSTLLSRGADGSLTVLGSTNAGGKVVSGCTIGDKSYFAGSFTTIGGTPARNVASYSTSTGQFTALGGAGAGLDGDALAVYCDAGAGNVWVGGSFVGPTTGTTGYAGSVAVYSTQSDKWSPAPFAGLTGAGQKVLSISPNAAGSGLYFTGSFLTSFQAGSVVLNGTSNPAVPPSIGATPFSTSLVPVPLGDADIVANPSSNDPQFHDIYSILCPTGVDGPGHSWRSTDGTPVSISVQTYSQLTASGIRLGNSFIGASTVTFSITSIPDDQVLTLKYVDPVTQKEATCSDRCPLSTDPSVPYQDFMFDTRSLTGILMNIFEWQGAAPGLHLLQLLSNGAFASAVGQNNGASCFAPNPSSVSTSGTWGPTNVLSGLPGTLQSVIVATVKVGSATGSAPAVTWKPYISASGVYDIFLTIPGCDDTLDCGRRTSVKVVVSPGQNLESTTTAVSQRVHTDTRTSIYSGPLLPIAPDFTISVSLTIADQPDGPGEGGEYAIYADRIALELKSSDLTNNGGAGSGSLSGTRRGLGVFEWTLSNQPSNSAILPNTTQTPFDGAGFQLFSATGNSTSVATQSAINTMVEYSSDVAFLGGKFTLQTGPVNIVAWRNNALATLPENGLNGPVLAMDKDGDNIYVGGAFTDSATGNGIRYMGVVRYDVKNNQWAAVGFGVNGPVAGLIISNGQLIITGSFTNILNSASGAVGPRVSGIATWDIKKGAWVSSGGFLNGAVTMITDAGNDPSKQFVAGNIIAARKFGSDGLVTVENGDHGPVVKPMGIRLGDVSGLTTQSGSQRRRKARLMSTHLLFPRQATAPAPLPALAAAEAPAVLAGTFWTNTTDSSQVLILGGNFTVPSGATAPSDGVVLYNPSSTTVTSLRGAQPNGTVRALLVVGNQLFVGGDFTLQGAQGAGLAIYDLAQQQWDFVGFQGLKGNGAVVVRQLAVLPSHPEVLVVAGTFTGADTVTCHGICLFDTTRKQWSALGSGVDAEIASITFAGSNSDLLVAAGTIVLPDNTAANVAQYSVTNATWSAVGTTSHLPGPATAVEVNELDQNSIFAAGRSSDGQTPYLSHWDGITWTTIKSGLQSGSSVTQLEMVPLTEDHSATGMIQSNRMLLISGSLQSDSFGIASSALYDGNQFYPYIVTSTASGSPGFVSALFHSFSSFSFNARKFLATGVVILVSIAIGAGIVFLLLLIGVLWTLFARREERNAHHEPITDDDDDSLHRPSSLLAHINAATRGTIIGTSGKDGGDLAWSKDGHDMYGKEAAAGMGAAALYGTHKGEDTAVDDHHHMHEDTLYQGPETPFEGVMSADETDVNRPAHARYSFDGTGEGELSLAAGTQVIVLNDHDPAWWYVRDANTLREGVVPAAYLY